MSRNSPPIRPPDGFVKKGGRKCCLDSIPELENNFAAVVAERTAGDPMEEALWTDLTPREIAQQLEDLGTPVSTDTVRVLLDEFDLGRRKAQKALPMGSSADRDEQFQEIARLKQEYWDSPNPILSMDTKKKEHLGNFYREGRLYTSAPLRTRDHDFYPPGSLIIPHGLYDLKRNRGHLVLGTSHDTSQFAVDCLWDWWRRYGCRIYAAASSILLLCDCGGSNGYRTHVFKEDLQRFATQENLSVRVAHYPPYCSKYNPIEHRLFCHVTRACQGVIFHTLEIVKRLIQRTWTSTGLKATANINQRVYETGRKASEEFLTASPIIFPQTLPKFNYTIVPQKH
jgi:hypothetical protein